MELLSGNGPGTRRCKAIGIDKEEEEEYFLVRVKYKEIMIRKM